MSPSAAIVAALLAFLFATTSSTEPEQCGVNEIYIHACQGDCANPDIQCIHAPLGCYCIDGFLKNSAGVCVPRSECDNSPPDPPALTCGPNESEQSVGYCSFDPDCASEFRGIIRSCPAPPQTDEPLPPTQACRCNDGFLRAGNNICEHPDKCCTGRNEISVNCPSTCDHTCEGPAAPDCQLTPCFSKGCKCRLGFVRNNNGDCIRKSMCRRINSNNPSKKKK